MAGMCTCMCVCPNNLIEGRGTQWVMTRRDATKWKTVSESLSPSAGSIFSCSLSPQSQSGLPANVVILPPNDAEISLICFTAGETNQWG